jgi:hypothetical protein
MKRPGSHVWHVVSPAAGWNCPAAQSMQFDVPFVATYVPAEQFVHVPAAAALYVPTAQGVHSLAPAPEYVPAAQLAQVVALAAAACLPAAQLVHALAAVLLHFPTVHGVHACAPASENLPAGQLLSAPPLCSLVAVHFARASPASQSLQYFPAWQASQSSQSKGPGVHESSPREHCPAGHAETTEADATTRIHLKRLIIAPRFGNFPWFLLHPWARGEPSARRLGASVLRPPPPSVRRRPREATTEGRQLARHNREQSGERTLVTSFFTRKQQGVCLD